MEYKCNNIELIDTGMGLHVEFRPLDDDPDKYFLLQKHFEDDQSFFSPVYIELYDIEKTGHYDPKVDIGKNYCIFRFGDHEVKLNYEINKEKLKKLKQFLNPLAVLKEI